MATCLEHEAPAIASVVISCATPNMLFRSASSRTPRLGSVAWLGDKRHSGHPCPFRPVTAHSIRNGDKRFPYVRVTVLNLIRQLFRYLERNGPRPCFNHFANARALRCVNAVTEGFNPFAWAAAHTDNDRPAIRSYREPAETGESHSRKGLDFLRSGDIFYNELPPSVCEKRVQLIDSFWDVAVVQQLYEQYDLWLIISLFPIFLTPRRPLLVAAVLRDATQFVWRVPRRRHFWNVS
jgi:hypothetical protein